MKQVVLKLSLHDERSRKKIMKTVSGYSGVDSISMDDEDMKLTVTGDIDPVSLVSKLRKLCSVDILSVGPPKAAEKKKEEPKEEQKDEMAELLNLCSAYNPYTPTHYYVRSVEENPNACVIF